MKGESEKKYSGFIVVDKPPGFTSHDVVEEFRRYFKGHKVGHLGTLDPLATGVLPVAVGKATKLTSLLLNADKVYTARVLLGKETDTLDISGEVVNENPEFEMPEVEEIRKVLSEFTGELEQVPPEYSAIHVDGERAYRLVRRGKKLKLKPRKIQIYSIDLIKVEGDTLVLRIHCSKGTYVRSLARDIARRLGTYGTLASLRRERTGPFSIEDAIPFHKAIEEFEKGNVDAVLMDVIPEKLGLKTLVVTGKIAYRVRHGVSPKLVHTRYVEPPELGDVVAFTDPEGELLAIARYVPSQRGDFEFLRVMG